MAIMRIAVDVELPDSATKKDVEELAATTEKYLVNVGAINIFGEEGVGTQSNYTYHNHKSTDDNACTHCRAQSKDGIN